MLLNHDTATFRAGYRSRVQSLYVGWLHLLSILIIGGGVGAYCMFKLNELESWDLLMIPVGILLYNFAEYVSHRWAGHKKRKLTKLFYKRHAGDHHSFFSAPLLSFETTQDWRIVLFPTYLTAFLAFFLAPVCGYLTSVFFSTNAGYLVAITIIVNHLAYELLHLGYHQPQGRWVHRVPVFRELAHLHRIHHQRNLMNNRNFNLTIPLFDLLLGTFHWEAMGKSKDSEN